MAREQVPCLIAGLGNPGLKYAGNRHNVGFRCVQRLATAHGVSVDKKQKTARVGRGFIGTVPVVLVLPQTFMNRSGVAIAALAQFYRVPLDHLLVVYDDLDLPFGSIRLRKAGGSGGHKGMQSIIQCLGNLRDFPRLRVGIGRPPGQMDPAAYVLRDFASDELPLLDETLDQAVANIE
ncbi:MAG: aminoacyl-tRNA hydrolase, partial [Anaerolineae bacterium]|nr:aminoacyl-tRNA hydrolase [Anaerolineae bacterium]